MVSLGGSSAPIPSARGGFFLPVRSAYPPSRRFSPARKKAGGVPVGAPTSRGDFGNETAPDVTRFFEKTLLGDGENVRARGRGWCIFEKPAPKSPPTKGDPKTSSETVRRSSRDPLRNSFASCRSPLATAEHRRAVEPESGFERISLPRIELRRGNRVAFAVQRSSPVPRHPVDAHDAPDSPKGPDPPCHPNDTLEQCSAFRKACEPPRYCRLLCGVTLNLEVLYAKFGAGLPPPFSRQNRDLRNEPNSVLRTVTSAPKGRFTKRTEPRPSHCHFGDLRNEPNSALRTGTSAIYETNRISPSAASP